MGSGLPLLCVISKSKEKQGIRGSASWVVRNSSWIGEAVGLQVWASGSREVQNICKSKGGSFCESRGASPPPPLALKWGSYKYPVWKRGQAKLWVSVAAELPMQ